MRRADVQHLRPVRRQGPAADRPGDHPREVQHAQPFQRTRRHGRQRGRRRVTAEALDAERRQGRGGGALRVRVPLREAPHGGDAEPVRHGRVLEPEGGPAAERGAHRLPRALAAEQAQHAGAVVREVGVQAHHAAVAAAVGAGDRSPRGPAAPRRPGADAARCRTPAPRGACRRAPPVPARRDGDARPPPRPPPSAIAGLRRGADAEGRGQRRLLARQRDRRERRRREAAPGAKAPPAPRAGRRAARRSP